MAPFNKYFYFNSRRDRQKISYERGDYESVDEKILSCYVPKNDDKKNAGGKALFFYFINLYNANHFYWR